MTPEDWRQELLADQKQEELYEYQMRIDEEFFLSEIDNEIEAYKKPNLLLNLSSTITVGTLT